MSAVGYSNNTAPPARRPAADGAEGRQAPDGRADQDVRGERERRGGHVTEPQAAEREHERADRDGDLGEEGVVGGDLGRDAADQPDEYERERDDRRQREEPDGPRRVRRDMIGAVEDEVGGQRHRRQARGLHRVRVTFEPRLVAGEPLRLVDPGGSVRESPDERVVRRLGAAGEEVDGIREEHDEARRDGPANPATLVVELPDLSRSRGAAPPETRALAGPDGVRPTRAP